MTPALGDAAPQSGAGFVCMDAGPLISFNDISKTALLGDWFDPVLYTPLAVLVLELKKRPKQNAPTISAPWLMWVPPHPDDAALIADMLRRFGKGPPENQGEAEVVAACKRYGWTAVLDDEQGRGEARRQGVTSVYTATLLACAAAHGLLSPTQAWKLHKAMETTDENRFSPLKPDDVYKAVFVDFANKLRNSGSGAASRHGRCCSRSPGWTMSCWSCSTSSGPRCLNERADAGATPRRAGPGRAVGSRHARPAATCVRPEPTRTTERSLMLSRVTEPPDEEAAQPIEEHVSLAAQVPAIPPDETPGLLSIRELSDEEVARYRADAALLRSVAPMTAYARAAEAVAELAELVNRLADASGDGTLSRRGRERAKRALAIVARTLDELPDALQASLRDRFGSAGDEARRLSEEHARLAALPSFRFAAAFESVPIEHLRAISGSGTSELVLTVAGVAEWPVAAEELPRRAAVGLVATAEQALLESQRLAARWLLEYKDVVRQASLRLTRLAAEVIEGAPVVAIVRMRRRGADEPEVVGMTPDPIPLEDLYPLQAAMQRAERVLETEPREPALRGAEGLYPEQILAAFEEAEPDTLEDISEEDSHDDDDEPGAPPVDLATVINHALLGTMALEQAWSRALADEDTEALLARWFSTIEAIRAELVARDRQRPEEERFLELPLTDAEVAAVDLAPGSVRAAHQARLAQLVTLVPLIAAIRDLDEPSMRLVDEARGRYAEWVASGAFATGRDQLTMLAELLDAEAAAPTPDDEAERARHMAPKALLRGDPEAAVLHLARALRLASDEPEDPDTRAVLGRITDAAALLARGEPLDLAALTLLADAGMDHLAGSEEPPDG